MQCVRNNPAKRSNSHRNRHLSVLSMLPTIRCELLSSHPAGLWEVQRVVQVLVSLREALQEELVPVGGTSGSTDIRDLLQAF